MPWIDGARNIIEDSSFQSELNPMQGDESGRRRWNGDTFDIKKFGIGAILEAVSNGTLQLPNFQRTWRWPDELIIGLLDSIGEGYPINSLMFLQTGGPVRFPHLPFTGVDRASVDGVDPEHLAMDGQQRITAMFQALYSRRPVELVGKKQKKLYRCYYIDMEKAIRGGTKLSEAIVSVPVNAAGVPIHPGAPAYDQVSWQCENRMFPTNMVFRFREWEDAYSRFYDRREDRYHATGILNDFRDTVVDAFTKGSVSVNILTKSNTLKSVSRIYEKINTGAVMLDTFDLLIARFAAEGFNLREDWHNEATRNGVHLELKTDSKGLLAGLTPLTFVSTVYMLSAMRAGKVPSPEKDAILNLSVAEYTSCRDDIIRGYKHAVKYLRRMTIVMERDLPSMAVVSALALVFGTMGREAEDHVALQKLERWFWSVMFSPKYGKLSSPVGADVSELVQWLSGAGTPPKSVSQLYLVDAHVFGVRQRKAPNIHKAVGLALMCSGVEDFTSGRQVSEHNASDDTYDIHHIFPKKWCQDQGISPDLYDSVANRTPLSFASNRRIGAAAPSQYIAGIESEYSISPEKMDRIIRSHGIDPAYLRSDSFDEFFVAREEYLRNLVEGRIESRLLSREAEAMAVARDLGAEDMVPENARYRLNSRGAVGYAVLGPDGTVVVLQGSIMSGDTNPSLREGYADTRKELMESGKLSKLPDGRWKFEEPVALNSLSYAGSVLSGRISAAHHWTDLLQDGPED